MNQLNLSQTAIHTHLRMPDITSSMKEDKKGPKNREITLGLGYSKNTVRMSVCHKTQLLPDRTWRELHKASVFA